MAIAYDSATNPTYVSAISHTFAHTCTGSDGILWVQTWRRGGSAVVTVVYNASTMTATQAEVIPNNGSGNEYIQLWYLAGPSTGANNVVVTSGISTEHIDSAVSYTGASQTGIPDAISSQSQTTQTNTTGTLTTIADNCWAIMFWRGNVGTSSAGASTTQRTSGAGLTQTYDGNSPKTPAGSYSLNVTHSNTPCGYVMTSFAPAGGGGGTPTPLRMLMGAGS